VSFDVDAIRSFSDRTSNNCAVATVATKQNSKTANIFFNQFNFKSTPGKYIVRHTPFQIHLIVQGIQL